MIKDNSGIEEYLLHEFAKQPPPLFDKGIIRKNTKSVMVNILKLKGNAHHQRPGEACFIIDGDNLL